MKFMIQIPTSINDASMFILQMEKQGYTAVRKGPDVHFVNNDSGQTSIDYCVTMFDDAAYVGIRPV